MSGKKKAYFPNNWQKYSELDSENFEEVEFDKFMDWKVAGWELPDSVCCVIRVSAIKTKKVTEHVYQSYGHAQRKIDQLIGVPDIEITICDHEQIHFLVPATDDWIHCWTVD